MDLISAPVPATRDRGTALTAPARSITRRGAPSSLVIAGTRAPLDAIATAGPSSDCSMETLRIRIALSGAVARAWPAAGPVVWAEAIPARSTDMSTAGMGRRDRGKLHP